MDDPNQEKRSRLEEKLRGLLEPKHKFDEKLNAAFADLPPLEKGVEFNNSLYHLAAQKVYGIENNPSFAEVPPEMQESVAEVLPQILERFVDNYIQQNEYLAESAMFRGSSNLPHFLSILSREEVDQLLEEKDSLRLSSIFDKSIEPRLSFAERLPIPAWRREAIASYIFGLNQSSLGSKIPKEYWMPFVDALREKQEGLSLEKVEQSHNFLYEKLKTLSPEQVKEEIERGARENRNPASCFFPAHKEEEIKPDEEIKSEERKSEPSTEEREEKGLKLFLEKLSMDNCNLFVEEFGPQLEPVLRAATGYFKLFTRLPLGDYGTFIVKTFYEEDVLNPFLKTAAFLSKKVCPLSAGEIQENIDDGINCLRNPLAYFVSHPCGVNTGEEFARQLDEILADYTAEQGELGIKEKRSAAFDVFSEAFGKLGFERHFDSNPNNYPNYSLLVLKLFEQTGLLRAVVEKGAVLYSVLDHSATPEKVQEMVERGIKEKDDLTWYFFHAPDGTVLRSEPVQAASAPGDPAEINGADIVDEAEVDSKEQREKLKEELAGYRSKAEALEKSLDEKNQELTKVKTKSLSLKEDYERYTLSAAASAVNLKEELRKYKRFSLGAVATFALAGAVVAGGSMYYDLHYKGLRQDNLFSSPEKEVSPHCALLKEAPTWQEFGQELQDYLSQHGKKLTLNYPIASNFLVSLGCGEDFTVSELGRVKQMLRSTLLGREYTAHDKDPLEEARDEIKKDLDLELQ